MASNTQYNPKSNLEYSKTDITLEIDSQKFIAVAGQNTVNSFYINDDMILDGAILLLSNQVLGDYIKATVIDKDNVLGQGAETVLATYIKKYYINPDCTEQFNFSFNYPFKIKAGVYLEITYASTGETDVDVIVNYKLHKILW